MSLRKKYTPTSLSVTLVISALISTIHSEPVAALQQKGDSLFIPKNEMINPEGPLSKLEVITAVKERYKGEIVSVRKKDIEKHKDCHHVRFINKQGDFLKIKVQCG